MKYTFVTGMGRSGTTFLAELLSTCPDCSAHHECIGDREFWLMSWYLTSSDYTVPYLQQTREQIEASSNGTPVFVDVNSYLRNAVHGLKQVFDGSTVFHLVRDPRKVIPSIYARRSDRDVQQLPRDPEELRWWLKSDKFDRICWNWADSTRRLMGEDTITVRLEDIVGDYDYVSEHFAKVAGVHIEKESWEANRSSKKNRTKPRLYRYLYARMRGEPYVEPLPPFEEWSGEQKDTYQRICGDLAAELGYE